MRDSERLENCWEFWDCPKENTSNCQAHKMNSGKDCYHLTINFLPRAEREFKHCWECPWCKYVQGKKE